MISFLRDHGLINVGDLIIVSLILITFVFFLVRTGIYLYFNRFGVPYQAKIVAFEMVPVLKNRSVYGEYIDVYQYIFEYKDQQGTTYHNDMKKLFSSATYQVGDTVQVRYLKNHPKRVRMYSRRDWFMFEFMALIISLVLFSILFIKTLV
ncbi:MAG: DUF3592 domain-containing protein [Amphibacillus sp.]|nr:DUF3592 domain-containing protein [Amphibacillus sp.]